MSAPKLRFKEFEGYLTESKLIELTSWASGGTPAKDIPEYWGDDIPLISGASMHTNQLYESDVKITKLGLQKGSKLAPKDSILILVRGSMLFNKIPMGITLGDVAFNQDVKCIRPKQELTPLFLFQWLHAKENTIQNKVTATGIGAGKLDTADLQNLKLYKPSSEEQTKISSFLSAVDEKINQLTQKHQLLSQYKQGMMQKIFSQQIHFKADDGSEFGAWESKKLNEIGQSFNGLVGKSKEDFGEGEAYITYKQIFDHRKINLNNVNFVNIQPNDTQNMVKKGDLFFTTSSETAHEVAYCSAILDDFEFPLYLNSFCFGYRPNSANILNSIYASFYFRSEIFRNKIKHLAQGSTRFNISKTAFMNVVIHLPMLEEQTKIANFLSSIDQKIEVTAQQIEQAKQWKKGLLQQMFV